MQIKKIILSIFLISVSFFVVAGEQAQQQIKGNIERGKQLSTTCIGCHGVDGNSIVPSFPKLAGQGSAYIIKQIQDYKSGKRENATMLGIASTLTEKDMIDLASYYSAQKISENVAKTDANSLKLAEKIYLGGKEEVPACISCHGAKGKGIPSAKFPAISAQHAEYIVSQLKKFRNYSLNIILEETKETRANDYASMMRDVAKHLSNKEIAALAQYIAGLH